MAAGWGSSGARVGLEDARRRDLCVLVRVGLVALVVVVGVVSADRAASRRVISLPVWSRRVSIA
jgi:hypothetical protein